MASESYVSPRRRAIDEAIYGIANGEEDALKDLYEQASGAVYAYALTVTGNLYDAQDIMHDTFVRIYESAPSYISKGKPMSWILRIVKNLCYDKFRSNSRRADVTELQLERQLVESGAEPIDRLVITKCLTELGEDERKIVVMHAVGGLKHREIAKELDLPLNTVLSKYKRAIAKLREFMKGEYYD